MEKTSKKPRINWIRSTIMMILSEIMANKVAPFIFLSCSIGKSQKSSSFIFLYSDPSFQDNREHASASFLLKIRLPLCGRKSET